MEHFGISKFLILCMIIIIASFVITIIIDRIRYNKKLNADEPFIPLSMIPELTRTIHCCNNFENIRYNTGDIFELEEYVYNSFKMKADKVVTYHVALGIGKIVKLTDAQVYRLEHIYNMKIREDHR